ncbi:MAG: PEP-CTERM sorting domain-containing protein [Candidatus Omnitrophica bacterium]|nr:PEP-CTERM sorting domain-containing protein [Candidatus Omnitrophota bacterium]
MNGRTKLSAIFFTALCLLTLHTSSASAFALAGDYTGPLEFKFSDFSMGTLYQSSSGGYGNADNVENGWGIFKINLIKTPAAQTLWFDGKDGEELTGIFYGIDDDLWEVSGSGLNIQSVGGIIDVYLDSSPDFDPTGGPAARTTASTYPTVTDGELFLRLAMTPGIKFGNADTTDDHIEYNNDLNATTSPFTGNGAFYANVVGGTYADIFDTNIHCILDDNGVEHCNDFFGIFDTTSPGEYQWLVSSEDPISGASQAPVPEPATLAIFGTGLAGMIGLRKRKNS